MNEPVNESKESFSIDISKLILTYMRKWWLFVLAAVLVGAIAFGYTKKFVTPTYAATVKMYVNNFRSADNVESISASSLSAAQTLVSTYVSLIKSDSIMVRVIDVLKEENPDLPLTAAQLKDMISATQVNNTEILRLRVEHTDPKVAAGIANVVADVSAGELGGIIEGSSIKIIDYAQIPTDQASPSYFNNTLYGAVAGILVILVYLTIVFLLDVEVKDAEELEQMYNLPVLGQIPNFEDTEQKHGYSSRKGRHAYRSKKSPSAYEYAQTVEENEKTAENGSEKQKKPAKQNQQKGGK